MSDRVPMYEAMFSDAPYGIVVMDKNLKILQVNRVAAEILQIEDYASRADLGMADDYMTADLLLSAVRTCKPAEESCIFLSVSEKYVERRVCFDPSSEIVLCFLRDITEEVEERNRKDAINKRAIEMTNRVIEKQMRVVQEIASLLGETTAETKIALSKLKDSLNED